MRFSARASTASAGSAAGALAPLHPLRGCERGLRMRRLAGLPPCHRSLRTLQADAGAKDVDLVLEPPQTAFELFHRVGELLFLRREYACLSIPFVALFLQLHDLFGGGPCLSGTPLAQRGLDPRLEGRQLRGGCREVLLVGDAPRFRGRMLAPSLMQGIVHRPDLVVEQALGAFAEDRVGEALHAVLDTLEEEFERFRHQRPALRGARR